MKMIMFSFCSFNCMIVLEDVICGTVECIALLDRCFYYFIQPIYIIKFRLKNINISLYHTVQFSRCKGAAFKMAEQMYQHLPGTVSTPTEHYHLHLHTSPSLVCCKIHEKFGLASLLIGATDIFFSKTSR